MGKLRPILYTLVTVIVSIIFYYTFSNRHHKTLPDTSAVSQSQMMDSTVQLKTRVHLYFADKEKPFLVAEERDLLHATGSVGLGKAILAAIAEGPQKELMQTFPTGASIRTFFIDQNKIAYVDIDESIKKHPGGTQTEILTIYSIVNSLVLNIKEIDVVKFLQDGHETLTLCGHFDTRFPLTANMLLIR